MIGNNINQRNNDTQNKNQLRFKQDDEFEIKQKQKNKQEIILQAQQKSVSLIVFQNFILGIFVQIISFHTYSLGNHVMLQITAALGSKCLDLKFYEEKLIDFKKKYWHYYVTSYIFGQMFGYCLMNIFFKFNESNYTYFYTWCISQTIYHMGEFYFVLYNHFTELCWKSYLINHSKPYNLALALCLIEYILEIYVFELQFKQNYVLFILGLMLSILGQVFRLSAFIEARSNFHHLIQRNKKDSHQLVTSGIYKISRHPSYFGFLSQSIGGQIMIINPVCIVGYTVVLYMFFYNRIYIEELYLVSFFGQSYVDYRNRVSTLIPFLDMKLKLKREQREQQTQ